MSRIEWRDSRTGTALAIILLLIVVISLVGTFTLSSSKEWLFKSGRYRAKVALIQEGEEAIQKAVRRIQEIGDPNLADSVAEPDKDIQFLLGLCKPSSCIGGYDPPCDEQNFDPAENLDVVTKNVVCNFMGSTFEQTQVMLARKEDASDGFNSYAVFEITAVTKGTSAQRSFVQGIAILPYEDDPVTAGSYRLPEGEGPYFVSWSKYSSG
ncbi:MAG TPA: hypothetical protein VI895_09055 [Bdellovibrionota bacterium]|nr:hypothetical protein [Bdellovibrionota bacterium]